MRWLPLAAAVCQQLCEWGQHSEHARSRCFARRGYVKAALEPGSPWLRLFDAADRCERALTTQTGYMRRNATLCAAAGCSWDAGRLLCAPSLAGTLVAVVQDADLGDHRCGLLGALSERGATCLPYATEEECSYFRLQAPWSGCVWNLGRCDVGPDTVRELVATQQEKFHLLHVQQARCAGRTGLDCGAPCVYEVNSSGLWDCAPDPLEALLAFAGRSCPYTEMLERRELCAARDQSICELPRRDGLADCEWSGACLPDPVTLETDLIHLPVLNEAQRVCGTISDRDECRGECVPERSLAAMVAALYLAWG